MAKLSKALLRRAADRIGTLLTKEDEKLGVSGWGVGTVIYCCWAISLEAGEFWQGKSSKGPMTVKFSALLERHGEGYCSNFNNVAHRFDFLNLLAEAGPECW